MVDKLEYASDSDDFNSIGPGGDESDEDLVVEDADVTVVENDAGYDMTAKNNLAGEVKKRNKALHASSYSDKVVEIAEDPSDDDSINSGAESDDLELSAGEEILLEEVMLQPSKTLYVEGNGDGEGEIVDSDGGEEDCAEKCSGDEKATRTTNCSKKEGKIKEKFVMNRAMKRMTMKS